MLVEVILTFLSLFIAFYVYSIYAFGYWKRKGVQQAECIFPQGSIKGINTKYNLGGILKVKYFESKGLPYYGINLFMRPALLVRDPALIKEILIKDFSSFHDRGFYMNEKKDPLSNHLFFSMGQKWRDMRVKMSPTFTSGKLKMMFPTMIISGEEMLDYLEKPAQSGEAINVKDVFSKYMMNIIARVAFGLELDTFKNPNSEFKDMGNFFLQPNAVQAFKNIIIFGFSKWVHDLPIKLVPDSVSKFFINVVDETMAYREKNKVKRNDFLQMLMDLKNKGRVDDGKIEGSEGEQGEARKYTLEEVAAQAFIFFIAGYETSSTSLQFTLFELAQNPDVQRKLQQEIDAVLAKDGKLTYESVMQMEYLEQVISESLRKYPATPFVFREAATDVQLPNSDVVIEKGVRVMISLLGLHGDPEYFPEPEKIDPDRFSPANKGNINPHTYLPFGDGPRVCIGNRFAMMQMKIGLSQFLSKYTVELCEKSPCPPIKFNPKVVITSMLGSMYLRIKKREQK